MYIYMKLFIIIMNTYINTSQMGGFKSFNAVLKQMQVFAFKNNERENINGLRLEFYLNYIQIQACNGHIAVIHDYIYAGTQRLTSLVTLPTQLIDLPLELVKMLTKVKVDYILKSDLEKFFLVEDLEGKEIFKFIKKYSTLMDIKKAIAINLASITKDNEPFNTTLDFTFFEKHKQRKAENEVLAIQDLTASCFTKWRESKEVEEEYERQLLLLQSGEKTLEEAEMALPKLRQKIREEARRIKYELALTYLNGNWEVLRLSELEKGLYAFNADYINDVLKFIQFTGSEKLEITLYTPKCPLFAKSVFAPTKMKTGNTEVMMMPVRL